MNVIVRENIIIQNPTAKVRGWAKQALVLNNPDYYKKVRLGKWTGNTPKTIALYEAYPNEIHVPFGCFAKLWKDFRHEAAFSCEIKPTEAREYTSNINLYPYQENAAEAILRAKNGILVMPCGSGKTQTGLEVIARIGGRALWLTHTQDLLTQSLNRAKSVLDIGEGTFGKITEGKVDIGTHITFATVQTMCRIDLSRYRDCFDVIVCDEAQHVSGSPTRVTQFYKVISSLSARYKIGLTATPKRSDGLEKSMFALLGDVAYEVTREDVKHTTCPVKVVSVPTNYAPDYNEVLCADGTLDYAALVDNLIHDEARFGVVSDYVNGLKRVIVLANRVEYIQRLCDEYGGKAVCLSTMGTSKKAKEQRKQVLRQLDSGEIDAVFATYQLAKEGLDVPSLRYVVFATPEKDETTVIQSAGRVGRKSEGKDYGTVIDFVDDFGMYYSWKKLRNRYFKKIDAVVN